MKKMMMKRTPSYFMRLPLRLGLVFFAAFFVRSSYALEASEVFALKCGGCHQISEFEAKLAKYNWPNLPLRTWLANHHKPRLPSISLSEAQITKMENSISRLYSGAGGGTKVYEVLGDEKATSAEISPENKGGFETGLLNSEKPPEVKEPPSVNANDCLNC